MSSPSLKKPYVLSQNFRGMISFSTAFTIFDYVKLHKLCKDCEKLTRHLQAHFCLCREYINRVLPSKAWDTTYWNSTITVLVQLGATFDSMDKTEVPDHPLKKCTRTSFFIKAFCTNDLIRVTTHISWMYRSKRIRHWHLEKQFWRKYSVVVHLIPGLSNPKYVHGIALLYGDIQWTQNMLNEFLVSVGTACTM